MAEMKTKKGEWSFASGAVDDQQSIKSITKTFSITNGKRISVINVLPAIFTNMVMTTMTNMEELGRVGGESVMDELDK